MTALLELRAVRAAYGAVEVLHGIDLVVEPGSVVAVLGANGAGKTTLLRVASGEIEPTGGDLVVGGRRLNGVAPSALARAGLCTVPEGRGIFPNLTVQENLWMATHRGIGRAEVEAIAYEHFPRLADRRFQVAGTMSGGEQQMLALGRGIATRPAVLLLDELSMGLAPMVVQDLFEVVGRLAATGVAVVIVEQFADAVLDLADRALIVSQGRVASEGTPRQIHDELRDAYFGVA